MLIIVITRQLCGCFENSKQTATTNVVCLFYVIVVFVSLCLSEEKQIYAVLCICRGSGSQMWIFIVLNLGHLNVEVSLWQL